MGLIYYCSYIDGDEELAGDTSTIDECEIIASIAGAYK
jgi:hypothetical protein